MIGKGIVGVIAGIVFTIIIAISGIYFFKKSTEMDFSKK